MEALDMAGRMSPDSHRTASERWSLIGTSRLMRGLTAEAEQAYARSLEEYRRAGGPEPVSIGAFFTGGFVNDLRAIAPERAVALTSTLYDRARRVLPPSSPALADDLVAYADALLTVGSAPNAEQAESLLRQALALIPVSSTPSARTAVAQSLLGGAILKQEELNTAVAGTADAAKTVERLREAEPLIIQGLDGIKSQRERISPNQRFERMGVAADRASRLYTLWNRLEPDATRAAKAQELAREAEQLRTPN
jgi:hypothetical protein